MTNLLVLTLLTSNTASASDSIEEGVLTRIYNKVCSMSSVFDPESDFWQAYFENDPRYYDPNDYDTGIYWGDQRFHDQTSASINFLWITERPKENSEFIFPEKYEAANFQSIYDWAEKFANTDSVINLWYCSLKTSDESLENTRQKLGQYGKNPLEIFRNLN
jgi:hypothetical protein